MHPRTRRVLWHLPLAALAVIVTGCGDGGADDRTPVASPEPSRSTSARDAPVASERARTTRARAPERRRRAPSIRILNPTSGDALPAGSVTVSVAVERFELVRQRLRPPFPEPVRGQGHVHFYLDTTRLPTRHGPPDTGVYRSISGTSTTWSGVAPGRHSLAVQLVGRDHAPLRPQAKDRVSVVVE